MTKSQYTILGSLKVNHDNSIVFKSRGLDQVSLGLKPCWRDTLFYLGLLI